MKSERRIQEMFKEIHAPDKLKEKSKTSGSEEKADKMESGDLPGRRAGSGADNGFHIIERDLLCCNRENMGQTVSCAFSGQKWKKAGRSS